MLTTTVFTTAREIAMTKIPIVFPAMMKTVVTARITIATVTQTASTFSAWLTRPAAWAAVTMMAPAAPTALPMMASIGKTAGI